MLKRKFSCQKLIAIMFFAGIVVAPVIADKTIDTASESIISDISSNSVSSTIQGSRLDLIAVHVENKPSDEAKEFVIIAIEASDLPGMEKKEVITVLNDMWSDKPRYSKIKQKKVIDTITPIVLKYYHIDQIEIPSENNIVQWQGLSGVYANVPHNDLAEIAGYKMAVPKTYCEILNKYASTPDRWGTESMLWHYSWGGAPVNTKYFTNEAKSYIQNNEKARGYQSLAYATHYMSDMGNPWHTAPIWAQRNHITYETYVSDNWLTGQEFQDSLKETPFYWYMYISDPEQSARNLASFSSRYFNTLDSKINNNPNWRTDPAFSGYTKSLLVTTLRYNEGLIDYIYR